MNKIDLNYIPKGTRLVFKTFQKIIDAETLIYTKDIEENDLSSHLQAKENISKEKISEFFEQELKKIYNV